jgi:Transposase domain (DUF772)
MFRMLVLQSLYNLSDEQVEYQVRDRLSFTRFLGLGIEDGIPEVDSRRAWAHRAFRHGGGRTGPGARAQRGAAQSGIGRGKIWDSVMK